MANTALILKSPLRLLKNYINGGHERTVRVKKNIAASLLIKGGSIIMSLLIIPITIGYINEEQFGIWLTLSAIIGWFSFFDIGLGNGLKNKLAHTNATGNFTDARIYVSTTYAVLGIIAAVMFTFFCLASPFINWERVLNTGAHPAGGFQRLTIILFFFFCVQFVVQIINTVLLANHATAKSSLVNFIGQLAGFLLFMIFTRTTTGSLLYLVVAFVAVPVMIQLIAGMVFFRTKFISLRPSFRLVNFKHARGLLSVGAVFFLIQIGALVLFQTDNIVITQLFGPGEVTKFTITYKLFSVVVLVFSIFMAPYWSSFTEAYAKQDMPWLGETLSKLRKYWLYLVGFTAILLLASPMLFRVWLHNEVEIPFSLSASMALYVIGYSWQLIHCYFLNGVTKLRIQLYLFLGSTLVNIPLAIFLGHKIGLPGIVLSNVAVLIIMGTVFYVQSNKIVARTATGIWNK